MSEISMEKRLEIEKNVESLLKQSGYSENTDSYMDIIDFAHHYGFNVVNADLDEKEDGFIAITTNEVDCCQCKTLFGMEAFYYCT